MADEMKRLNKVISRDVLSCTDIAACLNVEAERSISNFDFKTVCLLVIPMDAWTNQSINPRNIQGDRYKQWKLDLGCFLIRGRGPARRYFTRLDFFADHKSNCVTAVATVYQIFAAGRGYLPIQHRSDPPLGHLTLIKSF